MKYDDAEYCFLNFETDLENEAGGTHTGMYLAWAALRGLLDEGFDEATLAPLRARQITGSILYFDRCDGKLMDDDFNDEGNAFTASYYGEHFVADYQRIFEKMMPNAGATTDDFCSVPDTWENFDLLAPVLDQRFAQWQQALSDPPAPSPTPAAPALAPLALVEVPAEAVDKIRARAEGGDDSAWFDLGVEYVTGERVPHDMAKAADASPAAPSGACRNASTTSACACSAATGVRRIRRAHCTGSARRPTMATAKAPTCWAWPIAAASACRRTCWRPMR